MPRFISMFAFVLVVPSLVTLIVHHALIATVGLHIRMLLEEHLLTNSMPSTPPTPGQPALWSRSCSKDTPNEIHQLYPTE